MIRVLRPGENPPFPATFEEIDGERTLWTDVGRVMFADDGTFTVLGPGEGEGLSWQSSSATLPR